MTDASTSPVPVTLLTGFLGAGKTTLLNRILAQAGTARTAILVNDFGDLNIDADLIDTREGELLQLANGCICCSQQAGLTAALMQLLGRDRPPRRILIEASGISNPVAIAAGLMMPQLQADLRLASILALVDAAQAPYAAASERAQQLARAQVKAANVVILNKTDQASDQRRGRARDWIKALTPQARILEATHADVPLPLILDPDPGSVEPPTAASDHGNGHHHAPDHEADFGRWSYTSDVPFPTLDDVQHALQELPDGLLRVKGLVAAEETDQRAVLQMVGRRASFTFDGPWRTPARTRLMLIGRPDVLTQAGVNALFDARRAGSAAFRSST